MTIRPFQQIVAVVVVAVLQIAVVSKQITDCASPPSQMAAIVVAETSTSRLGVGKLQVVMVYSRNDKMQQIVPFVLHA